MIMKFSHLLYAVVVLALVWAVSAQIPDNCGINSPGANIPRFTSLTVFPNPARVGQQVHVRAVVQLSGIQTGAIKDGTITMDLSYKGSNFASIAGIPLCNSSSSIVCSTLGSGDNAISFDYQVPQIPVGKYTIKLRIFPDKSTSISEGCVTFDIEVQDPDANPDMFASWIKGQLAGVSQFEHEDYMQRTIGENLQIGPIGSISPILSYTFPWGTFINLVGSGDLIQPYFNPAGYVWGLNGEMEQMSYQGTTRVHVYTGDFYVGYVTSPAKRTLDVEILTGTFVLNWTISKDDVVTSTLSGNITFDDAAVLPFGFSNPITVGRLKALYVSTNSEGILMVQGGQNICLEDADCNEHINAPHDGGDDIEGWQVAIIVSIIVGVGLLIVIIVAVVKWQRRSRRHEEEDGIFSVARKPEYGNALVVDDIIQETREHSPNMVPALRGRQDFSDSESDYSRRTRSRSRTPDSYTDRSRSPSPARSRSRSASRSYDSESDYTDGSSADRV